MTRKERRTHSRAPLLATAVLLKDGVPLGSFRVVNASATGLLLEGEAPPDIERVEVALGLPERPVSCEAVVVRTGSSLDSRVFALAFSGVVAEHQEAIKSAVESALEEARSASVLIVDRNVEVCRALRAAVGRLGRRAMAVGTPYEATQLLQQPNSFAVALVDVVLDQPRGREVLAQLGEHHPSIRRVLMWGDLQAAHLELARRALGTYPVDAVLLKPWTDLTLAAALGP